MILLLLDYDDEKRKQTKPDLGNLGPDNYKDWAKAVIERYGREGMIVDAMVWGRIIALYEEALAAAAKPSVPS